MNTDTKNEMNQTDLRSIRYRSILFALLMLGFAWLMSGCKDDDDEPLPPYTITIADVAGIPTDVVFDKVVAEITGACWEVIGSVEAQYIHGQAVFEITSMIPSDKLQKVDWSDKDVCGHWPTVASDSNARVAKLGDFFAYNGNEKVGRIYLSDWEGSGATANKTFIYYHYTDRPFTLSGKNQPMVEGSAMFKHSIEYSAQFKTGWNAYANINPANPGKDENFVNCTTTIPDTELVWRFESYVY
ncbi:hypothetical protein [Bacteroides sp. 51]|uniref:hypothetical protein n=1 Tax=Bacteroides sp. 51 TaxID=2302938 RepID=UPI0013D13971|nr:hypothetical protein [Bacteroides sp. 51]NDV82049.1 hypothetical protein [Bacteroides sp. 51]